MRPSGRRVWFFAFPGSELLDVGGPWAVLGHANDILGSRAYELLLVTPLGGRFRTRHGLGLFGAASLQQAGRLARPDLAVVAGGSPAEQPPPSEAKLIRWLRSHHHRIPRIASICTGAFVLAAAGLLDGRRATTHWRFLEELRRRHPPVNVVDGDIHVRDGRIWTSAGITAGIDLTLALVEEDHGHATAMAVARNLLLFLRRSGSQGQFSEALKRQASEPPKLRGLSAFVLDRLDQELSVDTLASGLGMSARTLTRWCRQELGEAPAGLVRRIRMEEARRLLTDTTLPLKDIAGRTGLGDPTTLWRLFTRFLGVTPAQYRERFHRRVVSAPNRSHLAGPDPPT